MPNFKSTSFEMTELLGAGRICPTHVCAIQKTPWENRVKTLKNKLNDILVLPAWKEDILTLKLKPGIFDTAAKRNACALDFGEPKRNKHA